ncbi:MAG: hypothetical protein AAGI12_08975 [Pseudomonadota bacterium]
MFSIRCLMISLVPALTLALTLWAGASPASAMTCKERFIQAATQGNGDGQYRQIVTQKIENVPDATVQEFIMNGPRHWVSKSLEPKTGGWTLLFEGAMYTSADQGETWRQISKFDEAAAEKARAQQEKDVEAATDIECSVETVDSTPLDRVGGTYEVTTGFRNKQVHTYWFDQTSGIIVQSRYETIAPNFRSTVSQQMIPFADVKVPTP